MGRPITPPITATKMMTPVWLTPLSDRPSRQTARLTTKMARLPMRVRMNRQKYLQFRRPMQFPSTEQWWSNISTQFWHREQWLARLGRYMRHDSQKEPVYGVGFSKNGLNFSLSLIRKGRRGMMPGSVQAVSTMKRFKVRQVAQYSTGSTGETLQLLGSINTVKVTSMPTMQTQIKMSPGASLSGPVMQHLQRKRLLAGHASCSSGIIIIMVDHPHIRPSLCSGYAALRIYKQAQTRTRTLSITSSSPISFKSDILLDRP